MELSAKKMTLALVAGLIMLLWFADEYPAIRFSGDARFSGGPIFGYLFRSMRLENTSFISEACLMRKCHFSSTPREKQIATVKN